MEILARIIIAVATWVVAMFLFTVIGATIFSVDAPEWYFVCMFFIPLGLAARAAFSPWKPRKKSHSATHNTAALQETTPSQTAKPTPGIVLSPAVGTTPTVESSEVVEPSPITELSQETTPSQTAELTPGIVLSPTVGTTPTVESSEVIESSSITELSQETVPSQTAEPTPDIVLSPTDETTQSAELFQTEQVSDSTSTASCRKSDQEELIIKLFVSADSNRDAANDSKNLRAFIENYDTMLENMRQLSLLEAAGASFKKVSPTSDYERLQSEFQWHLRDAIEREYERIMGDAKTTHRNNHAKLESICNLFQDDIIKYRDRFDDESLAFAKNLLQMLFSKCHVTQSELFQPDFQSPLSQEDFDQMEGHQFEYFCANILKGNGFSAVEVTSGSGDQGVDVLAEKDGIHYAIQCKCYSSDLGNKPVQEVNAGKSIYHCQIGAVMTNRHFTQGAKDAAAATGVLLWDRDKLLSMIQTAAKSL